MIEAKLSVKEHFLSVGTNRVVFILRMQNENQHHYQIRFKPWLEISLVNVSAQMLRHLYLWKFRCDAFDLRCEYECEKRNTFAWKIHNSCIGDSFRWQFDSGNLFIVKYSTDTEITKGKHPVTPVQSELGQWFQVLLPHPKPPSSSCETCTHHPDFEGSHCLIFCPSLLPMHVPL